jgi:ubiquinone/menaquinone biosynthesis C-methylase UbiE
MMPSSALSYYRNIAEEYDFVTRAQDYDTWIRLYIDLLNRHGHPGRRLLDIGCGTGKSALGFAADGYAVTGVDFAEEMLAVARKKSGANQVTFVRADIRDLPELGPFDVVTAMGEPLGHLATLTELDDCLRGIARLLVPGGLFVFDVPTSGFIGRLATKRIIDDAGDAVVLWHGASRLDNDRVADVVIDTFIKVDDQNWRRSSQTLPNYFFTLDEVTTQCAAAELSVDKAYGLYRGDLQDEVDEQRHRKLIVIAHRDPLPATAREVK